MPPPCASTSDSCETLSVPRIRPLLGGLVRYQTCWFWVACGSRSPSWLETATVTQLSGLLSGEDPCKSARNPLVSPIATNQKPRCIFDSVQTASRGGRKHGSERGLYAIRCAVLGQTVGPTMVQYGSRIDSCETGFEGAQKDGAEGVLQLSDVMLWVLVGSTMKPRNQGWRFRGLSWWWAPLGVVKLGTNATPWS